MTHALAAFRTTRVWLLIGLDSAVLVLVIAAGLRSLAVAWVLAHLLLAWWCSGARDGRRLREALVVSVTIAVLANFLSSWFGLVAGLPIGAAVRDVAFVLLVAAAVHERRRLPISVARALAYGALVIATIASFHGAPSLSEIVGARTYLLYPLLLLPVASELNSEWRKQPVVSSSGSCSRSRSSVSVRSQRAAGSWQISATDRTTPRPRPWRPRHTSTACAGPPAAWATSSSSVS